MKTHLKIVALRDVVSMMPSDQYSNIRDAYYKASEGLQSLRESLEATGLTNESLKQEHAHVCVAIERMERCLLGKVI